MSKIQSPLVYKLEREIAVITFDEKLWLLAQIARQIQPASIDRSALEIELLEMASDPQIQREIANIELEFAAASMDGLKE